MTSLDHDKPRSTPVTGVATTGHEWDGVRELNQPLPRWWLWIFYATIVFAVGYWVVYPSWPLISSYAGGVLGWHSRTAVVDRSRCVAGPCAVRTSPSSPRRRSPTSRRTRASSTSRWPMAAPRSRRPAPPATAPAAAGRSAIRASSTTTGCGAVPPRPSRQTITHGVRNADADSRQGAPMAAFGRDGILKPAEIFNVANYVRSLSGLERGAGRRHRRRRRRSSPRLA